MLTSSGEAQSEGESPTEPVEVERDAQEPRLAHLGMNRAPGCPRREFAFSRRADERDERPLALAGGREVSTQLGADAMQTPGFLAALGRNAASGAHRLSDAGVGVGAFTVDLPIRQDVSQWGQLTRVGEHGAPRGSVAGRSWFGDLR